MEIQIWDNQQIKDYISKKDRKIDISPDYHKVRYEGFNFFGPKFISDMFNEMEIGNLYRVNRLYDLDPKRHFTRDRAVVNLDGSEINGILSLIYGNFYFDFPHYQINFLDVHEEKRNQGIATNLVRSLNDAPFLFGEKLAISGYDYSALGRRYAKHVLERELTGENFEVFNQETGVRIK